MTKELKPCPFCGGEAQRRAQEVNGLRVIYIVCKKCGATSGIYKTRNPRVKNKENPAIKAWNRREPIDKIVEQLEENWQIVQGNYAIERSGYFEGKIDAYDRAIEIVKRGVL